jgi:bifunctional UDP-N-acetylglucosamine pyrophosphorylase/glucosamine-1-phosphate N-acetyltransferase
VSVKDGAYVAAGSVITKEVEADALALTRAPQRDVPGWADKFRSRKRAEKAKRK